MEVYNDDNTRTIVHAMSISNSFGLASGVQGTVSTIGSAYNTSAPVADYSSFDAAFSSANVASYPGRRTNETSSVPMQIKPWQHNYEKMSAESDILFNTYNFIKNVRRPGDISSPIICMSMYNYLVAKSISDSKMDIGNWFSRETFTAEDVCTPASYVGVMRNEMALSGKSEFMADASDPHSRLFNVSFKTTPYKPPKP